VKYLDFVKLTKIEGIPESPCFDFIRLAMRRPDKPIRVLVSKASSRDEDIALLKATEEVVNKVKVSGFEFDHKTCTIIYSV